MDIYVRIARKLRADRKRISDAIEALEGLLPGVDSPSGEKRLRRRGRVFMGAQERRQVSMRMKSYWANRRAVEGGKDERTA